MNRCRYLLHEDVSDDVHAEEHPQQGDKVHDSKEGATERSYAREQNPTNGKKRDVSGWI